MTENVSSTLRNTSSIIQDSRVFMLDTGEDTPFSWWCITCKRSACATNAMLLYESLDPAQISYRDLVTRTVLLPFPEERPAGCGTRFSTCSPRQIYSTVSNSMHDRLKKYLVQAFCWSSANSRSPRDASPAPRTYVATKSSTSFSGLRRIIDSDQ